MKQLEDLDPSAIDTIEFNIKSVKKYTSLITVLLSVCIVCISLFINADSLAELWAPRSALTVKEYDFKQTTLTFTDQPICIAYSPTEIFSYLYVHIYSRVEGTNDYVNLTVPEVSTRVGLEYMNAYIMQNKSICYDLKGMLLKRNDQIRIDGLFPPSAMIYIAARTLHSIKNQLSPEIIVLNSTCQTPTFTTILMITTNEFVMRDQLYVNYEPERLYAIDTPSKLKCLTSFMPLPVTRVQLQFNIDYGTKTDSYIGKSYTFVRSNIAEILGNLLAWRGIIILPIAIALILFPIVEKSYKFELIKARLDSDYINNTSFTIWTDIKRRLSSCFPNKFADERVLDKALEKIQDELDLIGILQLQSVMRRQRSEFNQIERDEDIFDCKIEQKDVKIDMLLEGSQNLPLQSGTRVSIAGIKNEVIFSRNQEHKSMCLKNVLKSLIYSFDKSETTVSISTNQGKGYGSLWSICTFCTFATAIVTCLYMVGVFNMQGSQSIYSSYALDELESTIVIPPGKLAYRVTHYAYPVVPQLSVVDANENIIKNISMVANQDCLNMVATVGVTSPDWYCNAEEVSISSFDAINTRIEMIPFYSPPITEANKVGGTMEAVIMPNTLVGQNLAQYHIESQSRTRSIHLLRKVEIVSDGEITDGYEVDELTREPYEWTAMYIEVGKQYLKTVNESASYWDIFDSSWGIALIACNLVLFRIGRIINLRILSSKLNTEKQEKRSDILTVLFDIDRLSKGIYKEELSSVGFYYKYRLPNETA